MLSIDPPKALVLPKWRVNAQVATEFFKSLADDLARAASQEKHSIVDATVTTPSDGLWRITFVFHTEPQKQQQSIVIGFNAQGAIPVMRPGDTKGPTEGPMTRKFYTDQMQKLVPGLFRRFGANLVEAVNG